MGLKNHQNVTVFLEMLYIFRDLYNTVSEDDPDYICEQMHLPGCKWHKWSRSLKPHGIPHYVNFTVGILIKCLTFSSSSIRIKRLDTTDSPDDQLWE